MIQCVYIHVYQIIKNWGPGPYNSVRHANNRKYFSGLSLTRNRGEAHMFYLARKVGKIWRCFCWDKGNFIMINDFKYGETWTFWPSPLSLSLYSTFNTLNKFCHSKRLPRQLCSLKKKQFLIISSRLFFHWDIYLLLLSAWILQW